MKTTIHYFSAWLIIFTVICISCSKEEIYKPIETEKLKSTPFRTSPNTLRITREQKKSNFGHLIRNRTVLFKDQVWCSTEKRSPTAPYTYTNQMWSSHDGVNFSLRSSEMSPRGYDRSLVAFDNKLWLIGKGELADMWRPDIRSSEDGIKWSLVSTATPFTNTSNSGAVVFKDRMYVFETGRGGAQRVFSSTNGRYWHLENGNAFPYLDGGASIVFNNTLYYVGGEYESHQMLTNDIYKSTNGRDWSKVNRGPMPFPDTTIFGPRTYFGITAFENKVWVIGGSTRDVPSIDNEIWYSADMIRWTNYKGTVPFDKMSGHTLITFRDKIFLMGGFKQNANSSAVQSSREIWSIRPDTGLHLYK